MLNVLFLPDRAPLSQEFRRRLTVATSTLLEDDELLLSFRNRENWARLDRPCSSKDWYLSAFIIFSLTPRLGPPPPPLTYAFRPVAEPLFAGDWVEYIGDLTIFA